MKAINELSNIKDITELGVYTKKIHNIDFLEDLQKLKTLKLVSIDIDSLNVLRKLKSIKELELQGLTKVTNLEPISALENLKVLSILTIPGWDGSGKRIHYESLSPLSGLKKLEYLRTIDTEFLNDGLRPLLTIKSLAEFVTRNNYTTSDFALLEKFCPDINCKRAHAYYQWEGYEFRRCKKCGEFKVEFSGKDIARRVFCLNCNSKKVEELIERYNRIQESLRNE